MQELFGVFLGGADAHNLRGSPFLLKLSASSGLDSDPPSEDPPSVDVRALPLDMLLAVVAT